MASLMVQEVVRESNNLRTTRPSDPWGKEIKGMYYIILDNDQDPGDKDIKVPGGISYLIMDLVIPDTLFVTDPIQWFTRGEHDIPKPIKAPPLVRFHRIGDRRLALNIENLSSQIETYNFWIVVYDMKRNRIREADPGIIFEPYEPPGLEGELR